MKERGQKVLRTAAGVAAAGFLYTILYLYGVRIPCMFHQLTGLYCAGCGISRMFISLFRLDFLSAVRYNIVVLFLLPVLFLLTAQLVFRYLKTGDVKLTKRQKFLVWSMIVVLMLFGVIRNFPQFSFLQPFASS